MSVEQVLTRMSRDVGMTCHELNCLFIGILGVLQHFTGQ